MEFHGRIDPSCVCVYNPKLCEWWRVGTDSVHSQYTQRTPHRTGVYTHLQMLINVELHVKVGGHQYVEDGKEVGLHIVSP